jgi:hypothetical protein
MRMTRENEYYHEVSLHGVVRLTRLPGAGLSQAATVDNPVAGHEIVVIVGSPSKVAKATLLEFATKLTKHTRVNHAWSGAHVIVKPMAFRELPPLGEPRHVEGDLTAWILRPIEITRHKFNIAQMRDPGVHKTILSLAALVEKLKLSSRGCIEFYRINGLGIATSIRNRLRFLPMESRGHMKMTVLIVTAIIGLGTITQAQQTEGERWAAAESEMLRVDAMIKEWNERGGNMDLGNARQVMEMCQRVLSQLDDAFWVFMTYAPPETYIAGLRQRR